jgi:hypothetical protein
MPNKYKKSPKKTPKRPLKKTPKKSPKRSLKKSPKRSLKKSIKRHLKKTPKKEKSLIMDYDLVLDKVQKANFFMEKMSEALQNNTKINDFKLMQFFIKILRLVANELNEKHFNRSTNSEKFRDLENTLKEKPISTLFSDKNIEKAFNIIKQYKIESHPIHSSYNPFLEIIYKPIYGYVFENMTKNELIDQEDY